MGKRSLPRPCLILIVGVAGSGKTTLAREIVKRISVVYLDNNQIADAFFPHTRNGPQYAELRPHIYKALYTVTRQNLQLGNSVLLDVPHVKEMQRSEWRRFIKRMVTRTKAKLIIVRCSCSENALHSRIRSRGEQRDSWKLHNWTKFLRQEPIDVHIPFPHLDIDTEGSLSRNISAAMRYILRAGSTEQGAGSKKPLRSSVTGPVSRQSA
jgi:predicted kinase